MGLGSNPDMGIHFQLCIMISSVQDLRFNSDLYNLLPLVAFSDA